MDTTPVVQFVAYVVGLVQQHAWVTLSAVLIGLVVRLSKSDVRPAWFTVPARWRPVLALLLGVGNGVLKLVSTGTPWGTAVAQGVAAAFAAILGHALVIEGARGGRELFAKKGA